MKRLTGSKKVFAIASAVFLVAAASGSALAMIDQGFGSVRSQPIQRQIPQNPSGQTQQSPVPTPTHTPESHGNNVEFRGTVEVIAATGWVIGGRTVQVTGDTLVEVGIDVGSMVKVHAQRQADGSLVASKIELIQNGDNGNGNENENENENDNENHNGNVNSNDDDGNENENENENENHNGNINSNDNDDDHGNDNGNVNSNDNHDDDDHGNGNSNEHDDDHGGNGNDHQGGDDHGGDDHGGNGDD